MSIKIAPSLLAADFAKLGSEIAAIEAHIDWLHLDIMDGHFVPNISFGIPVIRSIRSVTDLYFDCHIMTTNPGAYLEEISAAGGNLVTVHIEAVPNPTSTMEAARSYGLDVGLVINPATPFEAVSPYVELCDVVVVMSVEPGFGGQSFIPEVLPKVRAAREWVENRGLSADIQVDGGVTPANAQQVAEAGASVLVAGSAVFKATDPVAAIEEIRRAVGTT
ncbi:MAG: ribulose-phosphate 3-epimerase [Actinomycetota bacterium]|nr:ribulose-phosphate 3-epimerase [Actinomycetota bacterium]